MLFVSKLLSMLIYPLGISSLLIALAAVFSYKRPRAARLCSIGAFAILFLASNRWVNFALVKGLEERYLPASSSSGAADAIVVLGGAVSPAFSPRPNVHLTHGDRLLYTALLYRSQRSRFVIVSGGRIPWQNTEPEGKSMVQVLELMGVPRSAILYEAPAANTFEEAISVRNVLKLHQLDQVLLVTSAMHMPRALRTFRRQGINCVPAPTDFTVTVHDIAQTHGSLQEFALSFLPDAETLGASTRALKEYLGSVYYRLRQWS